MQVINDFYRIAHAHPERKAFVSASASLTYREAAALVEDTASAMVTRGCQHGDPVAILSPNDPYAFVCMLAALRAGAAWVPVNGRNGVAPNAEFLQTVGCKWLFWHSAYAADAAVIRERVEGLEHGVQIDGLASDSASLTALTKTWAKLPVTAAEERSICTIVGTGGTTGTPKGVMWTNETWRTLLATATALMPINVVPVHLCVAPMTHAAGVLAMMLMPGGPTNVVLDRVDPEQILRHIAEFKVTHLYVPPTVLYMLLAHPSVEHFDYSSLRYFLITAAPVSPKRLREAVRVFGPVMAQCYGQSEAPMLCTFFAPAEIAAAAKAHDDVRLSSCGRMTPLIQLRAMSSSGAILPAGEVGELVVQGGLVMEGYLNDPAANAEVSAFGWHHTGDIGRVDPDGLVYVLDRKKDMIISGGFNVYPAEVERMLISHPAVQDCAVIGVPDDKWGEAITAVVELKAGSMIGSDELHAFCRERLGGVKTPKTFEFRQTLPRSAVGKVLRRTIRDEYWVGKSRAV